jgi:hypothetical protein
MNIRSILQSPARTAAVVAEAGLLFAACGTASGSEGRRATPPRHGAESAIVSAADADTLWHYLGTLTPTERAQRIIAFNPEVRHALAALLARDLAARAGEER